MARYISLLMDVEDPINEASDDAAIDCAHVLSGAGVTASMCITGEKLRCLHRRGRMDVLSALRPHAFGLHTNTHSYHPATMELLEDKGWDDGCADFYADTVQGVDTYRSLFGKSPVFWGGAGNTWGPQVAGTLPSLGIGAYVYALPSPRFGRPYRLSGCMAFPGGIGVGESYYESEDRFQAAMDRVTRRIRTARTPWLEVFIGHPTRMRHRDFWDAGFYGGITPEAPVRVEPYPESQYQEMLGRFERAVHILKGLRKILSVEEAIALPWRSSPASTAEKERVRRVWPKRLRAMAGWPVHKPNLDTGRIVEETVKQLDTLEVCRLAPAA